MTDASPWQDGQSAEQEVYVKFVSALGEIIAEQQLDYELAMGCMLAFIGLSIAELATTEAIFRKGVDIHCNGIRTHAHKAWQRKQEGKP